MAFLHPSQGVSNKIEPCLYLHKSWHIKRNTTDINILEKDCWPAEEKPWMLGSQRWCYVWFVFIGWFYFDMLWKSNIMLGCGGWQVLYWHLHPFILFNPLFLFFGGSIMFPLVFFVIISCLNSQVCTTVKVYCIFSKNTFLFIFEQFQTIHSFQIFTCPLIHFSNYNISYTNL